MKPGLSTTPLSGMQQRNIPGGQAMQGWRLFDGENDPPPPPPTPAPPPRQQQPPYQPPAPPAGDNAQVAELRAENAARRIRERDALDALEAERVRAGTSVAGRRPLAEPSVS